LAVATGKSRLGLERALDHSGLRSYFLASRCADECHSKPHPQMLLELLAEFALPPSAALMIGDTSHDLLMAQNAGVDALAVTYGAHSQGYLLEHETLVALGSVADVDRWLAAHG
jgi:phosphoglycolate phosphatase